MAFIVMTLPEFIQLVAKIMKSPHLEDPHPPLSLHSKCTNHRNGTKQCGTSLSMLISLQLEGKVLADLTELAPSRDLSIVSMERVIKLL